MRDSPETCLPRRAGRRLQTLKLPAVRPVGRANPRTRASLFPRRPFATSPTPRFDEYPPKLTPAGWRYTDDSYLDALEGGGSWHSPDGMDYNWLLTTPLTSFATDVAPLPEFGTRNLNQLVADGLIDEVIIRGGPYFGYYDNDSWLLGSPGSDPGHNYLRWWLGHMPRKPGRHADAFNSTNDGKLNNWWACFSDMNAYPESR